MKTFTITILCLLLYSICFAQPIPTDSLYLGQIPPGNTPKVFNLKVSTGSFSAERIAISNDGKEIYYTVVHGYYPINGDTIKYYRYDGSKWTGPFSLFKSYLAPGLSVTGDTMYFQNNNVPYQTLFSYRTGMSWSNPRRILCNINSAHYLQVTNNGNYYISSIPGTGIGASDWCRLFMTANDTTVVSLRLPLNNAANNLDFFVSRDETFMIVAKDSLRISFHKNNGNWTNPKSLGPAINFGLGMWGPYVSSDNKYLFYTTGTNPNYSDTYIYWVRIDGLMDSLMHTNFIPYLKNQIPNQTDTVGDIFNFTFPDSTFFDDDGYNTLSYSATLSSGGALPSWLSFNPVTRTFSGTPDASGLIGIKVTVTDTANATAWCIFTLNVFDQVSVHQMNENIINEYKLFQNFPNPFNPSTKFGFSIPKKDFVTLRIYDLLGKEVEELFSGILNTGTYFVDYDAKNISSGIYFYLLRTNTFTDKKTMVVVK
jgi:hypothetical protein